MNNAPMLPGLPRPNAPIPRAPHTGGAPMSPSVPNVASSDAEFESRCRILLVRENGDAIGYVAPLALEGDTVFQKSEDGALIIDVPTSEHWPTGGSFIRLLPPSQQAVAFPVIGVESHNNGSYWNLRACDEGRIGKRFNTRVKAYTPTGVGVASSKVWSVQMDEDGETEKLCLTWIDNKGTPVPLQAYALPNNLNVPTATKTFWWRAAKQGDEQLLHLTLERF
ncbi:hypothetical protein FRB93_005706 [Tulasnella sp. JGI-2019a]|nr:hypothetical protein FRB93_005706 [Tulasnella sp. JGI-2019a]